MITFKHILIHPTSFKLIYKVRENMFRIWSKIIKENRLVKDTVIELPGSEMSRTKKVYTALEMTCNEFDLAVPVWLEVNQKEFIAHAKTRFHEVNFMEPIDFDYLEFGVIEEDHIWE